VGSRRSAGGANHGRAVHEHERPTALIAAPSSSPPGGTHHVLASLLFSVGRSRVRNSQTPIRSSWRKPLVCCRAPVLVELLHHAGDPAALAPSACGPPLGLPAAWSRSPAHRFRRGRVDPSVGTGEPPLGVPALFRESSEVSVSRISVTTARRVLSPGPGSILRAVGSGLSWGAFLVAQAAHVLAADFLTVDTVYLASAVRFGLHRARHPPNAPGRGHCPPHGGLSDSAGAQPRDHDGRPPVGPEVPPPRPRRALRRVFRRGLPLRRGAGNQDARAGAPGPTRSANARSVPSVGCAWTGSSSCTAARWKGCWPSISVTTTRIDHTAVSGSVLQRPRRAGGLLHEYELAA
jgi:hypothetical protein